MKTLIYKELRESLAVGALGLLILGVLLVMAYRACTDPSVLTRSIYDSSAAIMQPLVAGNLLKETLIFCAAFGAVLGWLQIHRESQRDLWAFLVHRPLSRTRILLSKIVAGLGIYALVAGVPLVGLVLWVSIPGHILAPFEWRMAWPATACFLSGPIYHLAGMLTGLRQARWYASRGLGLGFAIIVSITLALARWEIALAVVLVGGALLAAAAVGTFNSNGSDRGQPALSKLALTLVFACGSFTVLLAAAVLVANSLVGGGDYTASSYQMAKDGSVFQLTYSGGRLARAVDANGRPMSDPKTGGPFTMEQVNQTVCPGSMLTLDFGGAGRQRGSWDSARYFQLWRVTEREVWFYWNRFGRVVGFDLASRQGIGNFGPNGFTNRVGLADGRFRAPKGWNGLGLQQTLTSSNGVYHVDTKGRTVRPLLTTHPDDPIGDAADVSMSGTGWDYTLAATRRSVVLLTPDAKVVWKVARAPANDAFSDIRVFFLNQTNHYAIWFAPSYQANTRAGWTLPTHVIWIDARGAETKRTELAALPPPVMSTGQQEWLFGFIAPPGLALLMAKTLFQLPDPSKLALLSFAIAFVCAVIAFMLGRAYAFSTGAQLAWVVFHLVFGLPGFLAFLALQEWPAREICSGCHHLRVVDHDRCDHCGAPFTSPPQTGTEIFEPARAE